LQTLRAHAIEQRIVEPGEIGVRHELRGSGAVDQYVAAAAAPLDPGRHVSQCFAVGDRRCNAKMTAARQLGGKFFRSRRRAVIADPDPETGAGEPGADSRAEAPGAAGNQRHRQWRRGSAGRHAALILP
jgi:hypothetical protein